MSVGAGIAGAKAGAAIVGSVGGILDDLFTSDEERLDKEALLTRLAQAPHLAQIQLNAAEATHRTIFVAGWRPFIGWVCGTGIAYHFIGQPLLAWVLAIFAPEVVAPPVLDFAPLMTLVMSLLGLGALRTVEKVKGKSA